MTKDGNATRVSADVRQSAIPSASDPAGPGAVLGQNISMKMKH